MRHAILPTSRTKPPPRSPMNGCSGRSPTCPTGSPPARERVKAALPEFEALRRSARDVKDHALANLDLYLEAFERNATAARHGRALGARPRRDASDVILDICREAEARLVVKSKSMVSEEIGLAAHLEAAGARGGRDRSGRVPRADPRRDAEPHHRAGHSPDDPADIAADFRRRHRHLPADRDLASPEALVAEARGVLREKFLPPTSASPAPTFSSPRPARPLSSPTRATPI